MLDRIRGCIAQLEKMRHPKMLQIIHSLEEGHNTIAFASEPIVGSLQNILAWHVRILIQLNFPKFKYYSTRFIN